MKLNWQLKKKQNKKQKDVANTLNTLETGLEIVS